MSRRGAVQRKVPCLFVTEVKEEPSVKRERQVTGAARVREGTGPCGPRQGVSDSGGVAQVNPARLQGSARGARKECQRMGSIRLCGCRLPLFTVQFE